MSRVLLDRFIQFALAAIHLPPYTQNTTTEHRRVVLIVGGGDGN